VSGALLLLDIGNSRIKAARWDGGDLVELPTLAHAGDAAQALAQLPATAAGSVWIAHVLGAPAEAALRAAVQARWQRAPQFARAEPERLGLKNGYAEAARLGVDRWLALLGAWRRQRGAALVIDAGTALTADAVDADGRHLGGFIAPGLLTAQKALLGATRFATRDLDAAYQAGFGRDTEACVRQGALLACLGAIDRAAAQMPPEALRLITGGDAARLLPHLDGRWQPCPLLVLEGLLAVARDGY
jgi:type III pantothenate kinase